ncbi:MAG TPA: V-type ATPase 116kDa subunit family protein [Bacteroidales bacterium]|nr:V-type ATPase 116kDa subunit family protein [Bacteroidales bacterium]HPF02349.1 V-type ATPase 116kDa subunit family protein [Bacteroidales bacterium]HPJ58194.1 V-type ATPase 116kDa subunit family protein [Bacteroidales bacterium]HPR11525.1 V-type ATPase 116kDa subunit family protein [Bacteroidales bacterium]HRW84267.1 V-type ATPase 116kDa subunit family protein [Bacteroidales bacterium]
MIAEIKKYTFLIHHSDYKELLDSLRKLGVVHIVQKRKLDESSSSGNEIKLLGKYRDAIRKITSVYQGLATAENDMDPQAALGEYESLIKGIDDTESNIELLKREAEISKPWDDFNRDTIERLSQSGWKVKLYVTSEKRFDASRASEYPYEIISRHRGRMYFAIVHKDDDIPEIQADEVKIPERNISIVREELEEKEKKLADLRSTLQKKAPGLVCSLNKGMGAAISRIEYSEAAEQADRYADDNLYVLEGWIPSAEEDKLKEMLKLTDCYSFVSEPEPDEKIPVILKNNRFSTLFEPISRLYALPAYGELDLTPFFAPFFMLFFGFCLGDAGYGLIFIIAGFLVKRKVAREYRSVITLAQYFGVAAVVMGLVSGTLFGINLIDSGYTITENSVMNMEKAGIPENTLLMLDELQGERFESRQMFTDRLSEAMGAENLRKHKTVILRSTESDFPLLNSFRHLMLDSLNMFYLALAIGALQILFGMMLKAVNLTRQKGFAHSLSTIGWVVLLITLIIFKGGSFAGLKVSGGLHYLYIVLLVIAAVLIFFFNNPGKNIFVKVGLGLWDSYGIVTGVFGDLLSYIRLFALGISSSILGFVFNEISLQFLSMRYVGWIFFVILLLVGHSLNIAIAALGSFVHPMRLTFVEFYKNAGFTGGGIEYKPFRIKSDNN